MIFMMNNFFQQSTLSKKKAKKKEKKTGKRLGKEKVIFMSLKNDLIFSDLRSSHSVQATSYLELFEDILFKIFSTP